jgi:hypothetical protein
MLYPLSYGGSPSRQPNVGRAGHRCRRLLGDGGPRADPEEQAHMGPAPQDRESVQETLIEAGLCWPGW